MNAVTKEDILYLFSKESEVPLSFADIKHGLGIASSRDLSSAKKILDKMVSSGTIILTKGEKYIYPEKLNLIHGTVVYKKRNFAFISDDAGGNDIFVKAHDLAGAIPMDSVILQIVPDNPYYRKKKGRERLKAGAKGKPFALPGESGENRRGRVIRIIKRNMVNFKALVRMEKNIALLTPVSPEFDETFYSDTRGFKEKDRLKNGIIVSAVLRDPNDISSKMAIIEKILGGIDSHGTEEEIVLNKYSIYKSFDEKAVREVGLIPGDIEETFHPLNFKSVISPASGGGEHPEKWRINRDSARKDLTGYPFVTIDGKDAKDFDDAVFLSGPSDTGTGLFKLYVAIADVSYFVRQGSFIDSEALKRGNSTYLPGRVYPMLPERLSNNLCSLLPKTNRFVMVCEMDIDGTTGHVESKTIYGGVIKTFDRLTYDEVYAYLSEMETDDGEGTAEKIPADEEYAEYLHSKLSPIKDMLKDMKSISRILRKRREKKGSLDFDSVKSKVEVDENGDVVNVFPEPANFAHEIIEDFMITANCAVAEFIESKKMHGIFRVHQRPDEEKIKDFLKILRYFKIPLSKPDSENLQTSSDYRKILLKIKEIPAASFLEQAFLRSMKIAVYSTSNIGHFGLALSSYAHFTSPIRRYADLMIHRILAFIIFGDDGIGSPYREPFEAGAPGITYDEGPGSEVSRRESEGMRENSGNGLSARTETEVIGKRERPSWLNADYLNKVCGLITRREKLSADAEREYSDFKKMQFLKMNEQAVYDGFITSVVNFGFFVDIKGFFIQGFVHVSTIADDYYEFNEHSKVLKGKHGRKIFKIGDAVDVSVYSIDLIKRQIDLRFISFS